MTGLILLAFGIMNTGTAGVISTGHALTISPVSEVIMAESSLPNSESKICDKCGSEKAPYKDKRYPAKVDWRCRPCTNTRVSERYHQNIDLSREKGRLKSVRYKETHDRYYQENKERWKEYGQRRRGSDSYKDYQEKYRLENAERLKEQQHEYYRTHADSMNEKSREHYRQNTEQRKAQATTWAKNNPEKRQTITNNARNKRRALQAETANTLTTAQWEEIQQRFAHRCAYCGKRKKLSMDHVTPISKGGGHTADNIVPACISCNSRKHVGDPLVPVQPLLIA